MEVEEEIFLHQFENENENEYDDVIFDDLYRDNENQSIKSNFNQNLNCQSNEQLNDSQSSQIQNAPPVLQDQDDSLFDSENDADLGLFSAFPSLNQNQNQKSIQQQQGEKMGIEIDIGQQELIDYAKTEEDKVESMIQKKLQQREAELQQEAKLQNRLKKRLLRNPAEYANFIKTIIMCQIMAQRIILKKASSIKLMSVMLSRFPLEVLNILESLKIRLAKMEHHHAAQNSTTDTYEQCLLSVIRLFKQQFCFRRNNSQTMWENLANGHAFTYEQMHQLFICICEHLGMQVRHVQILDLRGLSFEQRDRMNMGNVEKMHAKKVKKNKLANSKRIKKNAGAAFLNDCLEGLFAENKQQQIEDKNQDIIQIFEQDDEIEINFDLPNIAEQHIQDNLMRINQEKLANQIIQKQDNNGLQQYDDFAYVKRDPKKRNIQKHTQQKIQQNKTTEQETFIESATENNINSFQFTAKCKPQQNKKENLSQTDYLRKCDYDEFSQFKFWLECYNPCLQIWYQIDLINGNAMSHSKLFHKAVQEKLAGMPQLFITACSRMPFLNHDQMINTIQKRYFQTSDVTYNYVDRCLKVYYERRTNNLNKWWDILMQSKRLVPFKFADQKITNIQAFKYKFMFNKENLNIISKQKSEVPENKREFYDSPFYVIPSLMRRFQAIKPNAESPFPNVKCNEETIYCKSDLVELQSQYKWKKLGRIVRPNQINTPYKEVQYKMAQGEVMVKLFGEWQTEPLIQKLNEDGSLPANKYGNFEMFSTQVPLPQGTVYIEEDVAKACKENGIDHLNVVVGFDRGRKGYPIVVIKGVLAFQRDRQEIMEKYSQFVERKKEADLLQEEQDVLKTWRMVFKALLIKKQVREAFAKNE